MPSKVRGGKKLDQFIQKGKRAAARSKAVDVGFFSTAKYPDGTQVSAVAAFNEFGTKRIPERPFFRQAIGEMRNTLPDLLKEFLDPANPVIDERIGALVGEKAKSHIQDRITNLRQPENSPETIKAKKSDNPLIDTGEMRRSVSYRTK